VAAPADANTIAPRTVPHCLGLASLACCGVIALTLLYHMTAFYAWDDAYMFVRYADNFLASGKVAWNPGGEPTYGLTSPLFLVAVVLPIRLLAPGNAALAIVASSLVCGLAFLVLLVVLVWRHSDAGPLGRRFLVLLILFALAAAIYHTSAHFASGMDTMFALAYLTAYILIAKGHERSPSVRRAVLMGVWGGLAYFARPDLMVYSAIVPGTKARRHGLLIGLISGIVLAAQMAFAHFYFDTALPLPFYAKSLNLYGEAIGKSYRFIPVAQLVQYAAYFWFLFLLIAVDLMLRRGSRDRRHSPVDRGLLIATALFIIYYLGFVLQIMYMGARFYYPTLPAIAFLAAQSAARIARRVLPTDDEQVSRIPRPLCWLATLLFLYAITPQAKLALDKVRAKKGDIGRFSVAQDYRTNPEWLAYWFQLDKFAGLPDDLVIAATEIGRPGVMAPNKIIVDLTGLNETAFARKGFSPDLLFAKYAPDLIYMPHPGYKEMIAEIRSHPDFTKHYEHFPAETLGTKMGIALRRDSKHYPAMRKIVAENAPRPAEKGPARKEPR
jgi:hypothetical protein